MAWLANGAKEGCYNGIIFMIRLKRIVGFACALMPMLALGYTQLGSDRVLLMNNDTNVWNQVSYQGYNDTDQTKDTYWVHSAETGYGKASYLKPGITHTLSGTAEISRLYSIKNLSEVKYFDQGPSIVYSYSILRETTETFVTVKRLRIYYRLF